MVHVPDPERALAALGQAEREADDIEYVLLVGEAADIAAALENARADEALRIWARIANLDGERAGLVELVDEARTRLQSAGIDTLPTSDQQHAAYLASLSPAERLSWEIRILHGAVMSPRDHAERIDAARRALDLFAAHELAHGLTKKQAQRKLVFQLFLKQEASGAGAIRQT